MSPLIRFDPTDMIVIAGVSFQIIEQSKRGVILQQIDSSNVNRSYAHSEIPALLAAPDTKLKRGYFSERKAHSRLSNNNKSLASLPPEVREMVLWKDLVCRTFIAAEEAGEVKRTDRSVKLFSTILQQRVDEASCNAQLVGKSARAGTKTTIRKVPCTRTVLTWVRDYERSGCNPLSMLRKHRSGASYAKKFSPEVVTLLNDCIWEFLSSERPTLAKVVRDTRDRFREENELRRAAGSPTLNTPSKTEIIRRIERFDCFQTKAGRHGANAAQKQMGFYENGLEISHPLQWVEMDEWQIDVLSILGDAGCLDGMTPEERSKLSIGRRWIYVAIDVRTRCVVGFRLSKTPSAIDAVSTMAMIMMDKTPLAKAAGCESGWAFSGGCGTISTDMGSAFIADEFRIAVTDIGFNHVTPAAGQPKLRAHVERFFGTLATKLMSMLTGRTFSNSKERGDYPSEARTALTDDDLIELCVRFIVDIYHNEPHKGLLEETPANAWKRLAKEQGVTAPPDSTAICSVFGIPQKRKIERHGVRVFGIHYQSPEIQDAFLQGRSDPVDIRVDEYDLTYITVYLGGEWHSVKAVSEAVWGLAYEEWQDITRQLRLRYKKEAEMSEDVIYRARKAIKQINADAMKLRRLSPDTVSAADLERAERDLYIGLSVQHDRLETPVKDAPSGKGLLGDKILPAETSKEPPSANVPAAPQKPWGFRND
ncbi:Mu transposase C-terminal domain-containing protein [Sulfitobacter sp.]|uniref:Mu transposase C-terminal domain-containing protein n=1 Tax=Sulfitobacter sp. TaxID=1903071 RepID=UPI003EF13017